MLKSARAYKWPINAARKSERPASLPGRGGGEELYQGRSQARRFTVGAQLTPSVVLEERLGVRLLTRTTRSVAPTEAGERLLQTVGPRFDEIDAELAALSELREKPAGTIRITADEHAAEAVLWPALARSCRTTPTSRSRSPSTMA